MEPSYDLVIRGGEIVDGSGDRPRIGDVAVTDGRIVAVGDVAGRGKEEVDAEGLAVLPGFVDVHTHYDGQITWENRLAPSSGHGVTTVVMGNCGVGFAPVRPDQHGLMIKLMEGVEDIPEVVMTEGVPWGWESFPDYLDFLETRRSDIDFAAQLPHSPLRVYVMGERGVAQEPPTEEDLAAMRRLTAEAVAAGAVGVSTSRSLGHRFPDGTLAPSVQSEEKELMALAAGLADAGTGVFQLQSNRELPAAGEAAIMRRLVGRSGRPLSFTLIPEPSGDWRNYLSTADQARRDGYQMRAQYLPRPLGVLFGLDLSLHPFATMPSYRRIADLPLAGKVAAMRDPQMRARLMSETPYDPQPAVLALSQKMHPLFVLGDPPNYLPAIEDSLAWRAKAAGVGLRDYIYDALLEKDGHAILYLPIGGYDSEGFDIARQFFGDDNTAIGLGDGGAHYGVVCDGAYPTFMLSEWVMKPERPGRIPIERAAHLLACRTAQTVGLNDRGLLAPGYKADINLIDLDRLRLHPPRVARDLPAGGRRLTQQAEGYVMTMVSGIVTYRDGAPTGALPGRLVRGARPIPA